MRLVKHFERGYGHARLRADDFWEVRFFDNYDAPCIFSNSPFPRILTFCSEENDHDY